MELFKNNVGRPSNETIRKRRTIYVLIFVAIVALICTGSHYFSTILKNNEIGSKRKNAATSTSNGSGDVASEIKLGGDGKITSEDVEIITRLVAGEKIGGKTKDTLLKSGTKNKLADINGDGIVDESDIKLYVAYYIDSSKNIVYDVNIGDLNKNGIYDSGDINLLNEYIEKGKKNLTISQVKLADMNRDGVVNKSDIILLSLFSVGKGSCKNGKKEIAATLGDINCDGKITESDVILILKYTVNTKKLTETQKKQADIDRNGKVDKDDINFLKSIIMTGESYLIGDINEDEKIDKKDTELLKNYLNNKKTLDALQLDLADMDRDGKVTEIDSKILERIISGYGDVVNAYNSKGDGKLTWEDYELIANNIGLKTTTLSSTQKKAADINRNNKIDSADLDLLLNRKNNKLKAISDTKNGIKVDYNETTQILTLDGSSSLSLPIDRLTNQKFTEGEKYQVTLEYVSGSVTVDKKINAQTFEVSIMKKNHTSLSTANNVSISFPTNKNKKSTKTLTVSKTGTKEGSELYVWIATITGKKLMFNNYKIKVTIKNTSVLRAVFEPNGSKGERQVLTCNPKGKSSCTVTIPKITPKNEFEVKGWSTNKKSTEPEIKHFRDSFEVNNKKTGNYVSSDTIEITKDVVYYAITKQTNTAFFNSNTKNIYYDKNKKDSYFSKACDLYNGATSCTVKTPYIEAKSGETVLGWTKQKKSGVVDVGVNAFLTINNHEENYYPVIQKKIEVTFKTNMLDSFDGESKKENEKKFSCLSFGEGCYITLPEFNKAGYFNNFWSTKSDSVNKFNLNDEKGSEYFYKVNDIITITKNTTFYPNFNSRCYKNSNDDGKNCKFREINTQTEKSLKSFTIGKTLFEFESGIPDNIIKTFKSEMNKAYSKVYWLFGPVKVFVMTEKTYSNYSIAYGLTHNGNIAYNTVDLQYDTSKKAIDINAALHELGHTWDARYLYVEKTNELSSVEDFSKLYEDVSGKNPYKSGISIGSMDNSSKCIPITKNKVESIKVGLTNGKTEFDEINKKFKVSINKSNSENILSKEMLTLNLYSDSSCDNLISSEELYRPSDIKIEPINDAYKNSSV